MENNRQSADLVAQYPTTLSGRSRESAPNAILLEAKHGAGPPTPTKGDHVEDDNAWASQYREADFGYFLGKG